MMGTGSCKRSAGWALALLGLTLTTVFPPPPLRASSDKAPNNQLGDGVDGPEKPFLATFPYLRSPSSGYTHSHDNPPQVSSQFSVISSNYAPYGLTLN